MTEGQIQNELIKELESEGYYVIKLMKTNKNGIPDIIAIEPGGLVSFYEVKKGMNKLSPLQEYRKEELVKHGCVVHVYRK
jgi:Holliday junction resolvase